MVRKNGLAGFNFPILALNGERSSPKTTKSVCIFPRPVEHTLQPFSTQPTLCRCSPREQASAGMRRVLIFQGSGRAWKTQKWRFPWELPLLCQWRVCLKWAEWSVRSSPGPRLRLQVAVGSQGRVVLGFKPSLSASDTRHGSSGGSPSIPRMAWFMRLVACHEA